MPPAESSPSQPTFTGEAALQLALQGRKAWNEWAENPSNAGRSVEFSSANLQELATTGKDGGEQIDFQGFIFPGALTFTNCIFSIRGNFANATFKGSADFPDTTFKKRAIFFGATFQMNARFARASFLRTANFSQSIF